MIYQIVYREHNKRSHIMRSIDEYKIEGNLYCFYRQGEVVWTETVAEVARIVPQFRTVPT